MSSDDETASDGGECAGLSSAASPDCDNLPWTTEFRA